ncbi:MAG: hypothetical protein FP816_19215 [Desulfobacteraceae bacterium]|nr:hypothetical protein [Desulfobacteraceae bacterium]
MSNNNSKTLFLLVILFVLFAAGLVRLFQMRFEAGDLYPLYSSLRADPMGTRVMFESFKALSERQVSRNFKPMDQIRMNNHATVFFLGLAEPEQALMDKKWEILLDHLEGQGGRLVISFRAMEPSNKKKTEIKNEGNEKSDPSDESIKEEHPEKQKSGGDEETRGDMDNKTDKNAWKGISELGIQFIREANIKTMAERTAVKSSSSPDYFPESIFWPDTGSFMLEDPSWRVIYMQNNNAVVAARDWGKGTLVMMADSYLFSNEGLRKNRVPELLAWLAGPEDTVIFDEFHHGVIKTVGVADMINKYRLHGVVASLVVIMGLLVWRQMTLMPVTREMQEEKRTVFAQEAMQGWSSLVERHIPTKDLLNVCYDAWLNSEASNRVSKTRLGETRDVMAKHSANHQHKHNLATYQKLFELIKQGKTR